MQGKLAIARGEITRYLNSQNDVPYEAECCRDALNAFSILSGRYNYVKGHTFDILTRLVDGLPLTPITEDDFESYNYQSDHPDIKYTNHCIRMDLDREIRRDGSITYHDYNRSYCIDENGNELRILKLERVIDEIYPIQLPYYPDSGKYVLYVEDFNVGNNYYCRVYKIKVPEGHTCAVHGIFYKNSTKIGEDEFINARKLRNENRH
jgi:hypothetical protein